MTWRTAYSLDVILAEINAHAPRRSKASDGSVSSDAHKKQNPDSDHDPNAAGVVRARDFTHDPAGGLDCNVLAAKLAAMLHEGTHPALGSGAYVIWDAQIISRDRIGEGWRPYAGENLHTKHLHLSVATARAGYDSRRPWNLWPRPRLRRPAEIRAALRQLRARLATAGPVEAKRIRAAIVRLLRIKKR